MIMSFFVVDWVGVPDNAVVIRRSIQQLQLNRTPAISSATQGQSTPSNLLLLLLLLVLLVVLLQQLLHGVNSQLRLLLPLLLLLLLLLVVVVLPLLRSLLSPGGKLRV